MFYLILITFCVFVLFWLGDFYLTLKTTNYADRRAELNPVIRFILYGRRKFIYLIKPIEIAVFLYLIWFLTKFKGVISFNILLVFIFVYALLVVNNAHVYYMVTKKESGAFKIIFIALTIAILFFIYLNYLLYLDLGTSYNALEKSNDKYNVLYTQCAVANATASKQPESFEAMLSSLNLTIYGGNANGLLS